MSFRDCYKSRKQTQASWCTIQRIKSVIKSYSRSPPTLVLIPKILNYGYVPILQEFFSKGYSVIFLQFYLIRTQQWGMLPIPSCTYNECKYPFKMCIYFRLGFRNYDRLPLNSYTCPLLDLSTVFCSNVHARENWHRNIALYILPILT